jgi:4'-phosphopantetheinyl transferase EntD
MMRAILPGAVTVAESAGADPHAYLLPEEAAALGRVAETRRREFTAGRTCARRALAELGLPPMPILSGRDREPLWPHGIVGSITHCEGYCAAAVARASVLAAVGIDAEPDEALPDDVLERVALQEERTWLRARRHSAMHWDRLLFSAKESVFKAWFSATAQWLDFTDACVTMDPERGRFRACIALPASAMGASGAAELTGRYRVAAGRILTALVIERTPLTRS